MKLAMSVENMQTGRIADNALAGPQFTGTKTCSQEMNSSTIEGRIRRPIDSALLNL